ncbi:toll/interleukin-1 receptor domain-containing protein [Streptomyces sp. NBC_00620]|uniref:TIR domain-containing protein n=1 Tax=Streptomyces sp. NBC_00620 TaxID=2903666 RepID=UPI0022558FE5|nr:toll/interleukin-1 receptor domain-containing protein [Streptomyces sp. NBC_00620]MCX4974720.1 TIR domain-containing protein [Streptomyces sp. NBC_00620]
MPYEIFISYSRDATPICDDVLRILEERLPYEGVVFVDRETIPGGGDWWKRITSALAEVRYLLLLGTREAATKPDMILKELKEARKQEVVIVPVEFDAGAVKSLLGEGETHYLAAARRDDQCGDPAGLERALRRSLVQRVVDRLESRRRKAIAWAGQRLPYPSFWENVWDNLVPDTGAVVLVAPGGRGKSVVAAHFIDRICADTDVYPFLLEAADTARGADALAGELGARSANDLPGHLQSLREEHGKEVVFVVDALDQIPPGDDPKHTRTIGLLNVLHASCDRLLITCQDDVWAAAYAPSLAFSVQEVGELDEGAVARILHSLRISSEAIGNRLLRTPFFLDLALRRATVWDTIPAVETAFFRRLFRDAAEEGGPVPQVSGRRKHAVLTALAEAQLHAMSYEIPRATVHERSGLAEDAFTQAVARLKDDRLLMERRSALRLSHDQLDAYAVAIAVYGTADPDAAARELCGRMETEIGWPVGSMLVRLAHEQHAEPLLRTLFTEFLGILDCKRDGDVCMARAWGVTYVLRQRLPLLMPFVLEALGGSLVERPGPGSTPSAIGDHPRVTQDAASSLASAFGGLEAGDVADVPRVLPVLADGLDKFRLKGRFVEALAKYRTAEVRALLTRRGNHELDRRTDLPCLRYVAQGLRGFDPHEATTDLLERIVNDTGIDPVTRRRARETLHAHDGRPEPERDETEIVEGLRIADTSGPYSDWDVVREYASYVRDEAARGRAFGPKVVSALIDCFQHPMSYVGYPVAVALGCFDDDAARDALLEQLLRDVLTAEVREACLRALHQQFDRSGGEPLRHQLFAFQLLYAAHVARHRGAEAAARSLTEIVGPNFDTDALDVLPHKPMDSPVALSVQLQSDSSAALVDPALLRLEGPVDGPDLERKYRFTGIGLSADRRALEISLAPTSWTEASRFHSALRQDPGSARNTDRRHALAGNYRWIRPVPLGETVLPGIACVHCIVLSSDRQVLFSRRSTQSPYAPGRWSASFEEQLNEHDMGAHPDPFTHAACRGFHEEFGAEIHPARVTPLSAVIEIGLLNLALTMLLKPELTADEIEARWHTNAKDRWEAQTLDWLPVRSTALDSRTPAHPTTALRWAMLHRWLATHQD